MWSHSSSTLCPEIIIKTIEVVSSIRDITPAKSIGRVNTGYEYGIMVNWAWLDLNLIY